MNQNSKNKYVDFAGEIDLKEIFFILWNKKILIGFLTSIAAILSIIYALSVPNIYTSHSLLAPSTPEDSLTSKLGGLSSFGGLAGIDLTASGSKSMEAIERIKSFEFFSTYLLPNIKLQNIMAVKEWIPEVDTLIYDEKLYNKNTGKWVRTPSYPKKIIPSAQESFLHFKNSLSISENMNTSFITISIEHQSPIIAQKWVTLIINQVNENMRQNDQLKAEKSLDYLSEISQSTKIQSIRDAISNLLEDQMKTLMLSSSNDAYVFEIIDSPIVSELKSKPSRGLIVILGSMLGGMLSLLSILIHHYIKPQSNF